ncbi:MAG: hypothetical protein BRC26_02175 [Nanohaloarchaea archaeon QH_8_44_6]|nr:MAG: hypothetical protein BRC26_02175 [Nanohaloarchaea archaeon QH_8_44_6]
MTTTIKEQLKEEIRIEKALSPHENSAAEKILEEGEVESGQYYCLPPGELVGEERTEAKRSSIIHYEEDRDELYIDADEVLSYE